MYEGLEQTIHVKDISKILREVQGELRDLRNAVKDSKDSVRLPLSRHCGWSYSKLKIRDTDKSLRW